MDINRKTAYNTLIEMEKNKAYSNIELNRQISEMKPDSPAFVRELVYGVTENMTYIDYILAQLIPRGLKGIKRQPLTLLRMGIYQIIFMDSVPEYAAVNETVKMSRKVAPGRDRFINGVLRGYIKKKDSIRLPDTEKNSIVNMAIKYSFDPSIIKLWKDQYGIEKTIELVKASNDTPPLSLRVNMLKTTVNSLTDSFRAKGFDVRGGRLSERVIFVKGKNVLETEEFRKGYFSVQDEASVLAAEITTPRMGETIFDICSAPGGKALAMAEIMGNKGAIKAFDIHEHKLKLIEKEAERLGITIIDISKKDGTIFDDNLEESADRVLVDGPCSGLGVIRRKPEIKLRPIDDSGKNLAELQLKILKNAGRYVKKGGFLIYSTCTINKFENTEVVSEFLKKNNRTFELIRSRQLLPGVEETDGFFICKMRRKNSW